jgi:uncharacterized protein
MPPRPCAARAAYAPVPSLRGQKTSIQETAIVTERVTLITGASAGIGTELARVFAANGHRLALTARRADRLEALANELSATCGEKPIVIACDLQQADSGEKIAAALAAAGVELDNLVNNAGFGVFGDAIERDRDEQVGIVDVNVRALTDLSLRFADQLIRNKGGLLNVGSVAGFLPGPGMAVYYASKAYVISLTEALRAELAPRGVRVTVLCPGPVQTEFQGRAGVGSGHDTAILNVPAADVARQAYRGLMANKRAVLPGLGIKIVPFALRFFPRGFILSATSWFQRQRH